MRKRFLLIVLLMLGMGGLGFFYSKVFVGEEYRLTATVFFQEYSESDALDAINHVRYYLIERDDWISEALKRVNRCSNSAAIDNVQRRMLVERIPKENQANILFQSMNQKESKEILQAVSKVVESKVQNVDVEFAEKTVSIPSPWERIVVLSAFFGFILGFLTIIIFEIYQIQLNPEEMEKLIQQKAVSVKRVSPVYFLVKRGLDLLLGSFGLILFFIIYLLLIFPYSFGEDKGPVLFKQRRFGMDGKYFSIYKFRSMKVDSEEILKGNLTLYKKYLDNDYKLSSEEDPRITRIGRFLRQTSIDEIPQFINVVKGDMSMVGPRPIIKEEIKEYGILSEVFFAMKPGITGVWGANGRSNINYPQRAELELSYLVKRSITFDFVVICQTMFSVFKKDGVF